MLMIRRNIFIIVFLELRYPMEETLHMGLLVPRRNRRVIPSGFVIALKSSTSQMML